MAAVLSCGDEARLSHTSAAALWELVPGPPTRIELSVPHGVLRKRPGLVVHRRRSILPSETTLHRGIPVTSPALTVIDMARRLSVAGLERAINEADKRGLVGWETMRLKAAALSHVPGARLVRERLDRRTFRLTDSDLERLFLPLVRTTSLGLPLTGQRVNGFRVDFYWPALGLVIETDGLRFHRTPDQQTRGHRRDQAHVASGLTTLRFSHEQIKFEPVHVRSTLCAVADRLTPSMR